MSTQVSIRKQKRQESRVSALHSLEAILTEFRKQSPQGISFLSNAVFRAYPPTPQELKRFSDRARALQVGAVPSPSTRSKAKSGQRLAKSPQSGKDQKPKVSEITRIEKMPVNSVWQSSTEYQEWQGLLNELAALKGQGAQKEVLDKFHHERILPSRAKAYEKKKLLLEQGAETTQRVIKVPNSTTTDMVVE